MREFECSDESITVSRGVVDSFVAAFGQYRTRGERVVQRHLGVDVVSSAPDAQFSLAGFLGAMAELQSQFGAPFMKKVGSFIFDKATFPPGIDTIEQALGIVHVAYHMNHSKNADGRIGGYHWRATSERGGTMMCDNPYPCAFDMGILETIGRRFVPTANVAHAPGSCRHTNGGSCAYEVSW